MVRAASNAERVVIEEIFEGVDMAGSAVGMSRGALRTDLAMPVPLPPRADPSPVRRARQRCARLRPSARLAAHRLVGARRVDAQLLRAYFPESADTGRMDRWRLRA